MDASTIDQADLDRLTDKDKQELRQFIQNEQQRTRIQARMRPTTPLSAITSCCYCAPT
jgi:mitochondrial import inner membrane translocase subunit TIM8